MERRRQPQACTQPGVVVYCAITLCAIGVAKRNSRYASPCDISVLWRWHGCSPFGKAAVLLR